MRSPPFNLFIAGGFNSGNVSDVDRNVSNISGKASNFSNVTGNLSNVSNLSNITTTTITTTAPAVRAVIDEALETAKKDKDVLKAVELLDLIEQVHLELPVAVFDRKIMLHC